MLLYFTATHQILEALELTITSQQLFIPPYMYCVCYIKQAIRCYTLLVTKCTSSHCYSLQMIPPHWLSRQANISSEQNTSLLKASHYGTSIKRDGTQSVHSQRLLFCLPVFLITILLPCDLLAIYSYYYFFLVIPHSYYITLYLYLIELLLLFF